jgi:hypothetical protein
MPELANPDDHPLLPEDDDSELRYDERTTDDSEEHDADEQHG